MMGKVAHFCWQGMVDERSQWAGYLSAIYFRQGLTVYF